MSLTRVGAGDDIPLALRVKAFVPTLRMWDNEFDDFTAELLPERPPEAGAITNFNYPITSDIGMIAPRGDVNMPAKFVDAGLANETFSTKVTALGTKINPMEYNASIEVGEMGVSFSRRMEMVMKAIKRRIMRDRILYLTGDANVVGAFSTQSTARLKTWDVTSATDFPVNSGAWSTVSTNLIWQIDYINRYSKHMQGGLNRLIIGPDAEFYMNQNTHLQDLLKYTVDMRGKMVGESFRSLNINVVSGDTYKEESGNDILLNSPGHGSLSYETWADMKIKHLFRDVAGGQTWEYALLTTDNIGWTWRPPLYTGEKYPKENMREVSWWNKNPEMFHTYLKTRYGFVVDDFSKIHKITRVCRSIL